MNRRSVSAMSATCHRRLAPFFLSTMLVLAAGAARAADPQVRSLAGALEVERGAAAGTFGAAGDAWLDTPLTLRAGARGALVELGEGGETFGRLWLSEGASARLTHASGGVLVELERARARLALFDDQHPVRVATERGSVVINGADVLLERGARGTTMGVTSDAPELADWSLDVATPPEPVGLGTLETRTAQGDVAHLDLERVHVVAHVHGDVVETSVTHVFKNRSSERLEGTFRFPLPVGATPTGLAMEIGGRMMEGEIVDKKTAERVYQSIVDMMLDPAILTWEQGQSFKLRVFPIEPESTKTVELRYLSPLRREGGAWRWAYATAAADMQAKIPEVVVDFDGRRVFEARAFEPGREVVATLPAAPPAVMRETRPEGAFTALRLAPDWSAVPAVAPAPARRTLVVVADTSRSMLESRALSVQAVSSVLGALTARDRFVVLTCDVTCRGVDVAPRLATRAAIGAAVAELEAIEPDGASDLALALTSAGEVARRIGGDAAAKAGASAAEIVFIGDGVPTWRVTDPAALEAATRDALAGVSLHALVLGKGASTDVLRRLTALHGGKTEAPRTAKDVARFALFLERARHVRALTAITVRASEGDVVHLPAGDTLFEGDELRALIRTAPGAEPPSAVTVSGLAGGREVSFTLPLGAAVDTKKVARRFAAEEIARLERAQKRADAATTGATTGATTATKESIKATIIELSKTYGVLSKETALLVLESEEAYAQHRIERRQAAADAADNAAPSDVTGADLERLADNATLDPDRIQPGDPEVHIPAPADARAVVVVFPFGDTKIARWVPELRRWVVRFLIDAATPDGTYRVQIRITHRDGHVELLSLPYVVDTKAPTVNVTLKRARHGRYEILATQVVSDTELATADGAPSGRSARVLSDAKRVDVRLPDGAVLPLTAIRTGTFRAYWKPPAALTGPVTLTVVAVDVALNRNVFEVTLGAEPNL